MRKKDVLNFNVNIYALINPINDCVFYVGATRKDVQERLRQHCHVCNNGNVTKERNDLIKNLKSKGLKPEIVLLETVHFNDATNTEQFYFNLFKFYGFNMLQNKHAFTYSDSLTTKLISDWECDSYVYRRNKEERKALKMKAA